MKKWLLSHHLKWVTGLVICCCVASPAGAVQQDSSVDHAGFSCNLGFGSCACDGTYENCNDMEKSCKDQKIACTIINDQRICTCLMATKPPPAPTR
jgi:hypothetical protein